jgi:hypothetical protein
MKWLLAGLFLLLGACTHLPAIQPMDADRRPSLETDCRSHFPQGRWQLVHTIGARLYGGRQATFTGVVVLSTREGSIHCVLMTLEGMVLFEAEDDGHKTIVRRAFGPFDNDHFARGVMDDIRFLFFEPEGGMIAAGIYGDGVRVCRYQGRRETIVDLMELADGGWRMRQYDGRGKVLRCVTADRVDSRGISPRMIIDAGSGRRAYRLSMNLVEGIALP